MEMPRYYASMERLWSTGPPKIKLFKGKTVKKTKQD